MGVGKKIKFLRRRAELTQKQLGELTRMSRSHIAAIEAEAYNPSYLVLQRVAEVLRVPVSCLIDEQILFNEDNYTLDEDQRRLLRGFDELDPEYRQRLLGYLDCLLQSMRIDAPLNKAIETD